MIRSYLTTAWRNVVRQPGFTLINVFGLAIGLATSILILRYVQDEFNFDTWHSKGDRIYRVLRETRSASASGFSGGLSGALAGAIKRDIPEVEETVRIFRRAVQARFGDEQIGLRVCASDTTLFTVFDHTFVRNSVETAFPHPNAIALTESAAQRLFGNVDPIGKTLTLQQRQIAGDYTVTAILADVPRNTTLWFQAVITRPSSPSSQRAWDGWAPTYSWRPASIYVLLRPDVDPNQLEAKLSALIDRHMGPEIGANNDYHLQPLKEIHLYSGRDYGMPYLNDINRVYQFSAIALIVLTIACINFTNLTTARSVRRAKEVGLRKVVGAGRRQLVGQFLGDSILTAFFALVLAIVLVKLFIEDFNAYFYKRLTLDLLGDPYLVFALVGIAIVVGLLAGSYPAFVLSSFQPVQTLRGSFSGASTGQAIRKALVVVQFTISIILIVGTGVIYQQINYLKNKDLGFDVEQVLIVPIFAMDQNLARKEAVKLADRHDVIKRAFLSHPNSLEAAASRYWIGRDAGIVRKVEPEGHEDTDWRMTVLEVDEDYLDFFGIEMAAGRKFDPADFPSDASNAFIINETAARFLGWETSDSGLSSAVGKSFKWVDDERNRIGSVIGVVKDYHYGPLRQQIGPAAMVLRNTQFGSLAIRINTDDLEETLAFFKKTWEQFAPANRRFRYSFWDQAFEETYEEEYRVRNLTLASTGVAILLACMGLFGLASYAAEDRRQEVGVRKTLGASVRSVVVLVSKEFVVMVLIANIIAIPLAWHVMRGWLDSFAYRTDLGPLVFFLGAGAALTVAQLTVTYHALRAAHIDPVIALRDE